MKRIIYIILICFLICGCTDNSLPVYKQVMQEKDYIIIDVRTEEEYLESHIKGAINIPYDEINELSALDKSKAIMVYCQSGNRSSIAYQKLKSLNYEVYDLGAFASIDLDKE